MIDPAVADDLTRTGAPSFKFESIGDKVTIRLETVRQLPQTDFSTGEALTWPDGNPKMQFEFSGTDTATGDETRIFAKGQMLTAVKTALRDANAKPEVGGELVVKYDGEEPAKTRGFNPMKVYKARYTAPAPVANLDEL